MRNTHHISHCILGTLFSVLLFVAPFAYAATTVTNSVNVSSNSNGASESSASVRTVINGQVVEDWSATSSDTISRTTYYPSEVGTNISTTTVSSKEVPTSDQEALLNTLLARLQVLIQLYVMLTQL